MLSIHASWASPFPFKLTIFTLTLRHNLPTVKHSLQSQIKCKAITARWLGSVGLDPQNGQQLIINKEAASLTSSLSTNESLITVVSYPLVHDYLLIKMIVTGSAKLNQFNHGSFRTDRSVWWVYQRSWDK